MYPLPGNLLEWVEDCWHGSYAQAPQDGSPWLSGSGGDCAYRVVRGVAAAGGDFGGKRLAGRARESADARSPALGFRIARDLNALSKTALDVSGTAGSKAARRRLRSAERHAAKSAALFTFMPDCPPRVRLRAVLAPACRSGRRPESRALQASRGIAAMP